MKLLALEILSEKYSFGIVERARFLSLHRKRDLDALDPCVDYTIFAHNFVPENE
jgi:hypothetical protein